jgi:RNA polymerase sigma-70 factor (ECF subfamily)
MDSDLTRAKKGDREAMAHLVDEHYDAVYRFCARRIGPDHAQDAAQETFLTAQKRIGSFAQASSLSTWLFGIAHNHCRNFARKRKMETLVSDTWLADRDSNGDTSPATDHASHITNHEQTLVDREALRQALSTLSSDHREVVLLHEVEGLTYEEAATVLGIPVGTVKSRLHHAFQNLRIALLGREEVTA